VGHPVPRRPGSGLDSESSGSRAVVLVRGDLDGLTALQLESFLAGRALAGCRELEIDLAGVPSIGSIGLSALLGVRRWALQRGIALRLGGVQPSVWRVFELAGLDEVFAGPAEPPAAPAQELALF
jgi:anti-sigma B factor antagonist